MSKLELISECFIGEQFVCPIEYGDYSGLSDEEESQLNDWLEDKSGCFFTFDDEAREEFTRCEITGMMGACVYVLVYKAISNV